MTPQHRRTMYGINIGIALAGIGNFIYFPHLVATLGSSYSGFWAGFVMFMTYVGRLSATFSYEGFSARVGKRHGIVIGILVEAVALGLMAFAHDVVAYSALAFFVGFGSGTSFPGLKNVLGEFPEAARAKAFSSFQLASQSGIILGALAGGLFSNAQMPLVFLVVFLLFIGYCIAAYFVIPGETHPTKRDVPLFNAGILKGLELGEGTFYFLLSSLFWLLSLNFVVSMPLHMQAYVKELPLTVPFWITGVAMLLLQMPIFRFFNGRFPPGYVMAIAFIGMSAAYLMFGMGVSAYWVVAGCLIVILGDILFTPSFDMWVSAKIPADRLSRAMGAMHFFRSLGNMLGSFLAGLLFDLSRHMGRPGLNWLIVAGLALLCAVVSFASVKKRVPLAEQLSGAK
ncbi:MFS transporter [Chromobacterium subtsugae]|uniref:MFS transporter n=1 Tax=Chromobacterium subtsugae TaxID=251747 RepID=UPI0006412C95|nr:MFS transporter [Chromobacterium subtsugae]